ncbi:MAG: tRNA dihydrouridine(20/20a) synthase DusA [Robiginitomaculum sp.]|nr:tRNA dihydrouridine(20/20a) synthase DusA [Robiginitomaculum sp.]
MRKTTHNFAVAPMMDWTDRHCRVFHRMLSGRALLYSEMVVADAVIHGNREYLLGFDAREQPVALQVGGCDPVKLAQAARIGADYGYDEINLNVGCPSDRVQAGRFGASLMAEPDLVAKCFVAMQAAVDIPVTIKCRIGIDEQVPAETLPEFLKIVSAAGCKHFIIHARKAWLKGLSPKENRTIPPLEYDLVRAMKVEFPELIISLNGGLSTLEQAQVEVSNLDGVMLGRAAYHNPWMLSRVDEVFYGQPVSRFTRTDVVQQLIEYARSVEGTDPTVKALARHIMGLFHGEKGARLWRRSLSEADRSLTPSRRIETAFEALLRAKEKAA